MDEALHRQQQLLGLIRLCHKIAEPRLQGPNPVAIRVRRDGNARNMGRERVGLEFPEHFPAVQLRHGQVDHDQIRRAFARQVKAFLPVSGLANVVICVCQQHSEELAVVVVVLRYEYRWGHID